MRARASALLFVACCLWAAHGQNDSTKKSIWDDPIKFNTKAQDACLMHVSGQGDFTKLRISCRNQAKSYYCDYQGKPNFCRSYNNNPRHYFTQLMWELRKLQNACQGPKVMRPPMCRKAADEAQMVFVSAWPKTPAAKPPVKITFQKPQQPAKPTTTKPVTQKPAVQKPQPVPPKTKVTPPKKTTPKPTKATTTPRPMEPTAEGKSIKLAQEYCWKSLQGVCAYFISWFHN
ncbi:hypothetical protein MATL_G00223750 [Megalops atlanticus]|uniref:Fibroblast growth factor binding protein 2 n=1 Tax=Megalops atlanticus TaxID=7932 RepID=A0A9D3SYQ5_MEGAT|nr:hypothetical protein MATL_G00223750 [Megalops atlanticus]